MEAGSEGLRPKGLRTWQSHALVRENAPVFAHMGPILALEDHGVVMVSMWFVELGTDSISRGYIKTLHAVMYPQ
jgi:hypothetical protein